MMKLNKEKLNFQKDAWKMHFENQIELYMALSEIDFTEYEEAGFEGAGFLRSIKQILFHEFKSLSPKQAKVVEALASEIARYRFFKKNGVVLSLLEIQQVNQKIS